MTKPGGMAERSAAFEAGLPQVRATLGADGRLLIPAAMRDAAGLVRGELVHINVRDGALVITSAKADWKKLNGIFAAYKKPGESVVDEFLAERLEMWGEEE